MALMKRVAVTVFVAAGLAGGAAGVAFAKTEYVGGGTWYHGTTTHDTYSNYDHPTRCHGSTAVGVRTVRSGNTPAGTTSYAEVMKAFTNNQTYWRNSC